MKNSKIKVMTQLALLIAIEIVMKLVGLGSVPVGPLYMSFLTVPIAVGAIVLGPLAGALLGAAFGLMSFYDAVMGASAMGAALMANSPFHTFITCVITRILMGLCVGLIFKALKKAMKSNIRYFIAAFFAPALNTLFFMGYLCFAFYQSEYVQSLCTALNATNPIAFVCLLVGFQAVVEAVVCCLVGGLVSKTVDSIVNK
ncbi:MAG: ECF transporter S component [Bacillota bacterium]|nr:ECF transporter S component [Bacillota bacterium]